MALIYERKWRNLAEFRESGFGIDLTPHLGGSLGNVGTYLNTGITLRFGKDLSNDFGPPRIRPSLPGSGFFVPRNTFGWYLFAGVDGRAIAYNIFLDGNADGDSLSVDKEPLVADIQVGAVVTIGSGGYSSRIPTSTAPRNSRNRIEAIASGRSASPPSFKACKPRLTIPM